MQEVAPGVTIKSRGSAVLIRLTWQCRERLTVIAVIKRVCSEKYCSPVKGFWRVNVAWVRDVVRLLDGEFPEIADGLRREHEVVHRRVIKKWGDAATTPAERRAKKLRRRGRRLDRRERLRREEAAKAAEGWTLPAPIIRPARQR